MITEIIFSEFGPRDSANQSWETPMGRLDPTYTSFKKHFPNANYVVYTDQLDIADNYPNVEVRYIDVDNDSPFSKKITDMGGIVVITIKLLGYWTQRLTSRYRPILTF